MGVIIRQSISTTIISYIGIAIGYVNLLYLYPLFLSPDQVGLMRAVQDAAILMAQFAQFGLAQSIIRFFPRFMGNLTSSKNFINLILIGALIAFAFFLIVFFLFEKTIQSYFRANAAEFIHYTALVLWLTFITVITTLLEVYSRSLLKNILPNFLKEIVVRLLLSGLVIAYFNGLLDFNQVLVGFVLIYVACLVILATSLAWQGHLSLQVDTSLLDPNLRKELIQFSLLSFAGTAGLVIIAKVDSLMVAGLLGLTPVAIYTTSFYMATVIEIPKRAMTQVAAPLISRGFEKNDLSQVRNIYHKTALNQFVLGALLLIGIAANIDSLFQLMPKGDTYEVGKWVVIIVGVGKLVDMIFGPSSEIIVYSKYYWFNIILIIVLALVIVTANNLLIPKYGIEGAALGTALTLVIFNLVKFVFIWVRIKLQPFSWSFIKVFAIAGIAWTLGYLLPKMESPYADIFFRSAVITIVYGSLTLWTSVSPDANALFSKVRASMKK
jgi:O-antigen/teichoic acid export membrane protein